jgi:hypothetical protein
MKNLGTDAYLPLGRSALMKKELVPHENNYLGQGMMNWKGASLVCTLGATWKPFINVDVQNSAFLIGQKVLDAMAAIFSRNQKPDARNPFSPEDLRKATDVTAWQNMEYDSVMNIMKSKNT